MNFAGDLRFWIMVFAIALPGTFGSILFKYGTNEFGSISIEQLFNLKISKTILLYGALMAGGFFLFVFGGLSLRKDLFAMNYLFSPIIFTSLVLMFLSRFLVGIPLSTTELGLRVGISLGIISILLLSSE